MTKTKKVRNSTFEILRIVAILFILISHYNYSAALNCENITLENSIIANNFVLGDVGVAIFMMISGFFLRKSEKIDVMHIIKLIAEYYFYIFLTYGLSFALIPGKAFDSNELLHTVFGLFFENAWFVSAYLLVYIFHPFINKIFKDDNYKNALIFMIIITVVWSIVPTLTAGTFYLNRFLSLLCLYCYGAFLKLAKDNQKKWYNKKVGLVLLSSGFGFIATYQVVMSIVCLSHPDMTYMISWFTSRHALPMIIMISGLMMLFSLAKPIYSRVINFVAGFTLGIYLIHESQALSSYYWFSIFRVQDYVSTYDMLWHCLMTVSLMFVCCLAIDVFRKYALEMPLFKLVDFIKNKNNHKESEV